MPRLSPVLSQEQVLALTKPGRHTVGGVPGLKINVLPSGGKTWLLRMNKGSSYRREMGLGNFPAVSVAEARAKATQARVDLQVGIDPIFKRRVERDDRAQHLVDSLQGDPATLFHHVLAVRVDSHLVGMATLTVSIPENWPADLAINARSLLYALTCQPTEDWYESGVVSLDANTSLYHVE